MHARPAPVLFASSFAGQSALLVMAPLLTDVARAFDVSTATAGQSRAVAGVAGGVTALALIRVAGRHDLRALLRLGLALLVIGSAATAAAPAFAVLLAAQVAVGAGVALVLSASLAAAAEWPPPGERARVLTITIIGPPVSWVVGMPLVGLLTGLGWRAGLIVPAAAALIAFAAVTRQTAPRRGTPRRSRGIVDDRGLVPWGVAELLASAGWAGTLVYSGALLTESYGISTGVTATLLGVTAIAYLPGAFITKRWIECCWRTPVIVYCLSLAGLTVVAFAVRPSVAFTTAALSVLVFLAGGRTTAAAGYGLSAASKVGVSSVRAASAQFGYLFGAAIGGVALAAWGYAAVGVALAVLFAASAAVHLAVAAAERAASRARPGTRGTAGAGSRPPRPRPSRAGRPRARSGSGRPGSPRPPLPRRPVPQEAP